MASLTRWFEDSFDLFVFTFDKPNFTKTTQNIIGNLNRNLGFSGNNFFCSWTTICVFQYRDYNVCFGGHFAFCSKFLDKQIFFWRTYHL